MSKKSTVTEGRDIQFSMQLPGQLMCAGFSFHHFILHVDKFDKASLSLLCSNISESCLNSVRL